MELLKTMNSPDRPRLLCSSLYVIECSLIDFVPELGHTLDPLICLLWSDHTL